MDTHTTTFTFYYSVWMAFPFAIRQNLYAKSTKVYLLLSTRWCCREGLIFGPTSIWHSWPVVLGYTSSPSFFLSYLHFLSSCTFGSAEKSPIEDRSDQARRPLKPQFIPRPPLCPIYFFSPVSPRRGTLFPLLSPSQKANPKCRLPIAESLSCICLFSLSPSPSRSI